MSEQNTQVAILDAEKISGEKPVTLWRTAWRRLFKRKSAVSWA